MASKNVVVFTPSDRPFAIELGWIREVFTFGHVTPVPQGPKGVAGVVNFRGAILSIIDLRGLDGNDVHASQGESGLLLEVDRMQAALRAGTIDEVASLLSVRDEGDGTATLIDSRNREVELIDPASLFDELRRAGSAP